MKNDIYSNPKIEKLANSIGSFIEYWGFKEIQGKIWFLLYITGKEFSTKELREYFDISKGQTSEILNELKKFKVVYISGQGKHGVDLYKANDNILESIFSVIKNRELSILTKVLNNIKEISIDKDLIQEFDLDKSRLKKINNLVKYSKSTLNKFLAFQEVSWEKWKVFKS